MPQRVRQFKDQNFRVLRRECQRRGVLFEDPLFPASDDSVYYLRPPPGTIEWKRPGELCTDPRLFVDGISSRDLNQGRLGNCWFVAACSCLATEPSLWKKVIPQHQNQEWDPKHPERYAGIFRFRFCRLGHWQEVVIDDRLPTLAGSLLFCCSEQPGEFWCALLEKAYAKLNGCYEALDGGNTGEALVDFTGGISEPVVLDRDGFRTQLDKRKQLYKNLLKAHSRGALISCSIRPESGGELEARTGCGLVKGHAYGVTGVRTLRPGRGVWTFLTTERLNLLRLRNPWGSVEWDGPWSDGMSFDDFMQNFTDLVVCRRINTSFLSFHKTWVEARAFSQWSVSADALRNRSGGCINNRHTFLQNPQFVFHLSRDDTALLCLQQEDRRQHRREGRGQNLSIGFEIFRVEVNREYRLHALQQKVMGSTYADMRSVSLRAELSRGRYVVVTSTFEPSLEGHFLLQLFTDRPARLRELTLDQPQPSFWRCCLGYPTRVTSVHVRSAAGLLLPGSSNPPDAYVVMSGEGARLRSAVHKGTSSPDFDLKGLFYRRKPNKPIRIQVWSKGCLRDVFLGQTTILAAENESCSSQVLRLQNHSNARHQPGSLLVEICSSDELTAL
ncbi:calpain-5-like isoform X2 [Pristis pectinata]|uniref:calpain-5-like isoform X2 n=1 Tax=Pristis pectinata TaxID=685728 RepID=UPI00223D4771|nr:calpain-5-like isoform X2 [Pristis pectinata]